MLREQLIVGAKVRCVFDSYQTGRYGKTGSIIDIDHCGEFAVAWDDGSFAHTRWSYPSSFELVSMQEVERLIDQKRREEWADKYM